LRVYFFDIDGTITMSDGFGLSERNVPRFILHIGLRLYKPKIRQKALLLINQNKNRGKITLITARGKSLEKITKDFLQKNLVYYDSLIFVEPGPDSYLRKVDIVKSENNAILFDNNKRVLEEAKKRGLSCSPIL